MRGVVLYMAGIEIFSGLMSCGTLAYKLREGNYSGIGDVSAWNEKCEQQHGSDVTKRVPAELVEAEHRAKIRKYIEDHPELDEKKKADLKGNCPVPGMTKEEVRLFLNGPVDVISEPDEVARATKRTRVDLRDRVDEAWIYQGDTYFFQGEVLIFIDVYAPKIDPA